MLRVEVCTPPPHDLSQILHGFPADNLQSTGAGVGARVGARVGHASGHASGNESAPVSGTPARCTRARHRVRTFDRHDVVVPTRPRPGDHQHTKRCKLPMAPTDSLHSQWQHRRGTTASQPGRAPVASMTCVRHDGAIAPLLATATGFGARAPRCPRRHLAMDWARTGVARLVLAQFTACQAPVRGCSGDSARALLRSQAASDRACYPWRPVADFAVNRAGSRTAALCCCREAQLLPP